MQAIGELTLLRTKVDFLSRPESFPDHPASVEAIETHFAWVFLSRTFVYTLKKPIRFHDFDFTSLQARRANCELEMALNRRLAEAVYISVVPLGVSGSNLALECAADPVDWLVKMHRLPRERMLDQAAPHGSVGDRDLIPLLDKLAAFYSRTSRTAWDGPAYRQTLTRQIEGSAAQLAVPDLGMDASGARELADAQLDFIAANSGQFDARVTAGRVVDAHGDLRPEHIFLSADPQIIDCLEFSADLRMLDTAEEISFLALECERLGFAPIGKRVFELYRQRCDDRITEELFRFYRSRRALTRAVLSAWHLRDDLTGAAAQRWLERANWYVRTACEAIGADRAPATLRCG